MTQYFIMILPPRVGGGQGNGVIPPAKRLRGEF